MARSALPWLIFGSAFSVACSAASSSTPASATIGGAGGHGAVNAGTGGDTGLLGSAGFSGSRGGSAGASGHGGGGAAGAAGTGGAGTAGANDGGTAGGSEIAGNAGMSGSGGSGGTTDDRVPGLVGVGYGGLRVVSRDNGAHWSDAVSFAVNGGDDENLLRAVVYGNGQWLATGWKFVTSSDGVTWQDHGLIHDLSGMPPCNIIEGLAFKDGYFYGACNADGDGGVVFRSSDGMNWERFASIGVTQGHLFLTYRGSAFVAYGDAPNTYQSSDAKTWTALSGVTRGTYCEDTWKSESDCHDSSWFSGAYLRSDWQARISRSIDGNQFADVYDNPDKNTLYQSRAIAAGMVAPARL